MAVYKKNGRYHIDYYLPNGKRKREVVKISGVDPKDITRKDAEKALALRKAQVIQGNFDELIHHKKISFEKLCRTYIGTYAKPNKKSWKRDVHSIKNLFKFFGEFKINQITHWQVEHYKSKRSKDISYRGTIISKATVNREIVCLKKMFNKAIDWDLIKENPTKGVKLYKEELKPYKVVSPGEFEAVYQQSSDALKPVLLTAYNTGMRYSEVLNLKWSDINFDEGFITVTETKSGKYRTIPMNETLRQTLVDIYQQTKSEYVFVRKNGEQVKSIRTAFHYAIKKSGVDKFVFHDLRHSFASRLVMKGVDLITVQQLLGHSSVVMTERYSHPSSKHKMDAVFTLDADSMDTKMDTFLQSGKLEVL